MTEHLTSHSFPDGAKCDRTEAEVRALRPVTMLHVIQRGARGVVPTAPKCCPWCSADPFPAVKVCNRWVIACENENCKIDVQAAGDTPEEAWAIWNARP